MHPHPLILTGRPRRVKHGFTLLELMIVMLIVAIMTTLALPAGYLDEASVTSTAVTAPYNGGWAWTGQESGREAIKPLLAALGARLIASRSGGLRLWPLRALASCAA